MARLDKTIQKSNTIRTKNGTLDSSSKIQVFFYKSSLGKEIKLVQLGWPIGMPLVRNLRGGLWEIRIRLVNRIARVIFTMIEGNIVLLHGFIKKQQDTPHADLELAFTRLKSLQKD
jgi:phage-related protein